MPTMPAIAHVAVTVNDLAVSVPWYTQLFGSEPVLDENTGPFHHTVYLLGNTLFGVHGFPELQSTEAFEEHRIPRAFGECGPDQVGPLLGVEVQGVVAPQPRVQASCGDRKRRRWELADTGADRSEVGGERVLAAHLGYRGLGVFDHAQRGPAGAAAQGEPGCSHRQFQLAAGRAVLLQVADPPGEADAEPPVVERYPGRVEVFCGLHPQRPEERVGLG